MAGQIIPWNYPLLMAAWKLAPAIAAGCTVRSETGRADAAHRARVGESFRGVRRSAGRGQHRDRLRRNVRRAHGAHPDVNKIAFTGSAAVGKIIISRPPIR